MFFPRTVLLRTSMTSLSILPSHWHWPRSFGPGP
ncbi:hypothetical protein FOPG_18994 [Fusarium oxysporum f. sp. conglutinans race 2 54008]|uniref:Uncharacterized protein n=1 Tax=Fusarium oxysporum f. sp. conglutinans race 2 54008 TaxID=1089457 RepID=X0GY35_FUSOX|nr:hypothetical protein FOPG_18994 [Fusarium oxysporum f. sp. conglutinans race 2 54008]